MAGRSHHKKQTEQLTMIPCEQCGNYLNATEFYHGNICGKCRSPKPEYLQQNISAIPDRQILKELAAINLTKEIHLDNFNVNYMGAIYKVDVYADGTLNCKCVIYDDTGKIVFVDRNGTKEGIDVFEYCKLSDINLLKQNVDKDGNS